MHYAFDEWMTREYPQVEFARYADDLVIHCRSRVEAETLLSAVKERFRECKLSVHPEKTKIVFCKDDNRRGEYENTEFDFLGFTFRPRHARNDRGQFFVSFSPAISRKAEKSIRDTIRSWRLDLTPHCRQVVKSPILSGGDTIWETSVGSTPRNLRRNLLSI